MAGDHNHDCRREMPNAALPLPAAATMMRPPPRHDRMPMKVKNWIIAVVLLATAAALYAAIIVKMS